MKWNNPKTGEKEETGEGVVRGRKIENVYNENIAILTGGPSLADTWHDGMYSLFNEVWAINLVGKRYFHDYVYYLDTPRRIFGEDGVKQWPKTIKGFRDRKPMPLDRDCNVTFPSCFRYVMEKSRADARIYIFGWDMAGKGVVDGKEWNEGRQEPRETSEMRIMRRYWNADKVAGVSGKAREWAEKELGFNATPINRFSKPDPPPRAFEKEKVLEERV